MAEFCSCGSIMIGGNCTNKNCSLKPAASKATKASARTKAAKTPKEPKKASTRRASKCITYNLYDVNKEENTI